MTPVTYQPASKGSDTIDQKPNQNEVKASYNGRSVDNLDPIQCCGYTLSGGLAGATVGLLPSIAVPSSSCNSCLIGMGVGCGVGIIVTGIALVTSNLLGSCNSNKENPIK